MMKAITGLQRVFVFKGTEERGCKEQEDIFMLILQLSAFSAAMIKWSLDEEDVGKFAPWSPAVYHVALRQGFD